MLLSMVDKRSEDVRRMFASVAHRYDLLNRLLSLNVDRYWRKVTRRKLRHRLPSSSYTLDLCAGTGDLALEMAECGKVIGCDFCRPMLSRGLEKVSRHRLGSRVRFVEGDALNLPFRSGSFDALTIAFGLRNLENETCGLGEMLRVLRSGGTLAVLEFSLPTIPGLRQLYLAYFTRVLPKLGALISGRDGPYSYLPDSVREFPSPEELGRLFEQVGFESVRSHQLTLGIAALTLGTKP
jgi:demethylmenaquinone methyltransferase/2-methoxy-6-polyprenyl-1,4-benzoquinol methylase